MKNVRKINIKLGVECVEPGGLNWSFKWIDIRHKRQWKHKERDDSVLGEDIFCFCRAYLNIYRFYFHDTFPSSSKIILFCWIMFIVEPLSLWLRNKEENIFDNYCYTRETAAGSVWVGNSLAPPAAASFARSHVYNTH